MATERLTPEDCGVKILTCYLVDVENIINLDDVREKVQRDKFGFARPKFRPPRPDPRDE